MTLMARRRSSTESGEPAGSCDLDAFPPVQEIEPSDSTHRTRALYALAAAWLVTTGVGVMLLTSLHRPVTAPRIVLPAPAPVATIAEDVRPRPGDCLIFHYEGNTQPTLDQATVVDCESPHNLEVTGTYVIPGSSAYPGEPFFRGLFEYDECRETERRELCPPSRRRS